MPGRKEKKQYKDYLREAMRERGVGSIRELANRIDLSYEQVRKIYIGEPVVSEESNNRICNELGLDEAMMWEQAKREKFARRYAGSEPNMPVTLSGRMAEIWPSLAPTVQERVYNYAAMLQEEHDMLERQTVRSGGRR